MAKVLVVDDNAENRQLVKSLLVHSGHVVFEAADGATGLEVANRERPDLMISDVLMPAMDGYELVNRLRAAPTLATTKVIFYTAHFREEEARRLAEACGVRHILFKPCEPEEIVRVVGAVLASEVESASATAADFDAEHLRLLTDKLSREAAALQAANGKLAAVNYLNLSLSAERDTQALLNHVCAGARDLIGCRYAIVVARDKAASDAVIVATSGLAEEGQCVEPPALDANPHAAAMEQRRALRMRSDSGVPTAFGFPAAYPAMYTIVSAPLVSPTRVYGWICLADKIGASEFSEEDERLLGIVAAQAGRIYENGSLYAVLDRHARDLEQQIAERIRTSKELERSEKRFRQLAETINEVFWISTEDYAQFSYISPAYEQVWGRSRETVYRDASAWTRSIHQEDRPWVTEEIVMRVGQDKRPPLEFRIVRPDGSIRWIQAQAFTMVRSEGSERLIAGAARDITERREHEDTIARLGRMYALLSGINSTIVRVRDRNVLLQEACRIAVTEGGFVAAWAGFVDPESLGGCATAHQGLTNAVASQIAFSARDDAASREFPASTAIRTRAPAFFDASLAGQPASVEYQFAGHHAMVAMPIMSGTNVLAVIVFAATRMAAFDRAVMKLLAEMCGDIAFGLEHIAKEEQISYLACHDVLTGLPNQQLFFDHLGQLLRAARSSGTTSAVVLIDIVHLRRINESLGRHIGDAVLRHVGAKMAAAQQPNCRLARIDADTFAVAVGDVQRTEDLQLLVCGLSTAAAEPLSIDGQVISATVNVGIAVAPTDGDDVTSLFNSAEAALTRATSTGVASLFYSASINAKVNERVALERRLQQAVERREFVLHYQPKVNGQMKSMVGMEALLRWNDPERGLISPINFISVLEETGLILQVGSEVMQTALEDYRSWREMGLDPPRIAVNVSALQLKQPNFADSVRRLVYSLGRGADALEIEITESMLMNDLEDSIATLRRISDLGVEIAIDDFGTGYSSLRYLARLPVDTVKIDRSFVEAMVRDPDSMTIVSTIISLAHSLGLSVCAEGVESEEQARFLTLLRCDYMQGYLFSPPVPADEMAALLKRGNSYLAVGKSRRT